MVERTVDELLVSAKLARLAASPRSEKITQHDVNTLNALLARLEGVELVRSPKVDPPAIADAQADQGVDEEPDRVIRSTLRLTREEHVALSLCARVGERAIMEPGWAANPKASLLITAIGESFLRELTQPRWRALMRRVFVAARVFPGVQDAERRMGVRIDEMFPVTDAEAAGR
jgi:hypothetical protein